ncbi:MAG TPA: peptidylprolyl isomerase [Actinomycetota bacterium]|nr:peptidylprolyl isomerase [Actinomycetota bacterium]
MIPRPLPRLSFVAIALSVVLAACGVGRPPAATVGGDRITDDQLAQDIPAFRFLSAINQAPCGQAIEGETAQSACARFTLTTLIQENLVKGYARAHHITVAPSEVTKALTDLRSALGDTLDQQLAAENLTERDLTDIVGRILLFNDVQTAVATSRVDDAQLRQLYQEQRLQFTQIHAKHILVKTRAQALRIEHEVTAQNFGRLAEENSIDPGSASNGGDLGPLQASTLNATFVQAALKLQPGEISEPVHTGFGWHIIQLVSVDVRPFDQVRDQLAGPLRASAFTDWLQEQLGSRRITVNPKYGRFDPSTGNVEPIRSTASGSPTPSTSPTPVDSP